MLGVRSIEVGASLLPLQQYLTNHRESCAHKAMGISPYHSWKHFTNTIPIFRSVLSTSLKDELNKRSKPFVLNRPFVHDRAAKRPFHNTYDIQHHCHSTVADTAMAVQYCIRCAAYGTGTYGVDFCILTDIDHEKIFGAERGI